MEKKDTPGDSICNAAMTACRSTELIKVGSAENGFTWRLIKTSMEWKNDKWRVLNKVTAYSDESGSIDRVYSRCTRHTEEPLSSECLSGEVYMRDGAKWEGGYTLMYSGAYPLLGGYGRVTFNDGRWAEGTKGTEGKAGTKTFGTMWVSLSQCGKGDRIIDCELDGQTVTFIYR
jgi:hypothetical protein